MKMPEFKLEEFWKKYEFTSPYLLCCSDAETWTLQELLTMADSETKQLWESLTFNYTEIPGHPLLREEIARLYSSLNRDNIFTFAGAEEGIYCTMKVLIEPGDHVIVIDPCYQSLSTLPKVFGAKITPILLKPENGWKLELTEVEMAFQSRTKLIVLNYPHNPTGTLLEKEVLEGIIELARKNGAYVFSDEVYRYMEIDEKQRLPSIVDAYEKGITLNVMTKSFGLAGLRIGWLAAKDPAFLKAAGSYKLYTTICNSAPSEILAIMALKAKEKIFQRNREIMLKNLNVLDAFMERNTMRLAWVRPQSGTMAVLKLLLPLSVETFTEDLVRNKGVLIMPGSVFDLPGNYFRIGFGKKNMPEILGRLESYLQHVENVLPAVASL
ncbi:MAG: aminotransferase class I/II-fold pyridoxal phosphate-dependent enzyme [Candidatus Protochlamydia sp.]|nr:aminotransferase class I/II-fold pyridoxal phosphate-dependent enzyme [Candidatus Protochlamydia sp.]